MWEEPLFIETNRMWIEGYGPAYDAFDDIYLECARQAELKALGKFPHTPQDAEMSDDVFLRIVVEEVGEVARAIHDSESDTNLYAEICQIAAICAARMEGMRAQGRI